MRSSVAVLLFALVSCTSSEGASYRANPLAVTGPRSGLVVRVLDVGQGDATLIENGGSRVLIDGGPDVRRFERLLDSLDLNDSTFDVVILSHQHADHLIGLRALFESRRHIKVRYFFENKDPSAAANLRHLRDSILARVDRNGLIYRDTDDPCANGTPVCTITMRGGAVLHIMRSYPGATDPNDRSAPVKLVGPDSASFTMWFGGDAQQMAVDWFVGAAGYAKNPGMEVDVLKADHHGSCNGLTNAYLDALHARDVVVSVGAVNPYGHMHTQAKAAYRAHGAEWYRTDQNGTITIESPGTPGAGYHITPQRPGVNRSGPSDRRSNQSQCRPIP